jgi:hypothetical protein
MIAGAVALPAAAAMPSPSIAMPEPGDPKLDALWERRAELNDEIDRLFGAYQEAHEALPAWARPGFSHLNRDGSYRIESGEVGWPEVENPQAHPDAPYTLVRPSLSDIRERYRQNPFSDWPAVRASYRASVRAFIGRLREQRRLEREAGLDELQNRLTGLSHPLNKTEDEISAISERSGIYGLAARTLLKLGSMLPADYEAEFMIDVVRTVRPLIGGQIGADCDAALAKFQTAKKANGADDDQSSDYQDGETEAA